MDEGQTAFYMGDGLYIEFHRPGLPYARAREGKAYERWMPASLLTTGVARRTFLSMESKPPSSTPAAIPKSERIAESPTSNLVVLGGMKPGQSFEEFKQSLLVLFHEIKPVGENQIFERRPATLPDRRQRSNHHLDFETRLGVVFCNKRFALIFAILALIVATFIIQQSFENTTIQTRQVRVGAVASDGWVSSATGQGATSHHGGVDHWLTTPVTRTLSTQERWQTVFEKFWFLLPVFSIAAFIIAKYFILRKGK